MRESPEVVVAGAAAPVSENVRSIPRRDALALLTGTALAPLVHADLARDATPGAPPPTSEGSSAHDWSDPNVNLRTFTRMFGTLEPGKIGYMYFFGRGIGTTGPTDYTPLFRMESVAVSRSTVLPSGAIHYRAGQVTLFLDWETGEVLDRWKNPYTGETVDVFHYRDYPLGYTVDFADGRGHYSQERERSSRDPTAPEGRRPVTWNFRKGYAFGDNFSATRIKSRLDPAVWKRESVGEFWETFEHYQWQAKVEEITDANLPQIRSFRGDFQTFKPWEPFMLMDQRPGKIFQQKTCMNIRGFEDLPPQVARYLEKQMASYLDLDRVPEKAFKLNDQHYMELRKPAPAPRAAT